MAATPILRAYHDRRPNDQIVMSVITPGGHEVASSLVGPVLTGVFYAPFDVPVAVKRALRTLRPDVLVVLETELWPNMLYLTRRAGARVVLVNGRISDRSLGAYRRLRGLFRWVLAQFDRILAQSPADAGRFAEIGGPADRIESLGNSKFDQALDRLEADETAALRADLGLQPGAPVLVVGSTRQPEEEEIVLDAYDRARAEIPDLALVYAPRHVERAPALAARMQERGLSPVRRTEAADAERPFRQLILDTFGELGRVYAVADVAFIGNSLVPPGGGQNLLQPLAQGKPVLYGKYMQNFRDITAQVQQTGLGDRVEDAGDLAVRLVSLLRAPEMRQRIADGAVALLAGNQGAAARYADAIAALAESAQ